MNERRVNKLTRMWQSVYRTVEEETDGTIDRRVGKFITGGKLRGDLITGDGPGGGTGEHAANHHKDGSDPISLDLLATVENDTDLVLKPDGDGGVQWVTPPSGNGNGGGGGFPIESFQMVDSAENVWTIQIGTDGALISSGGDPNGAMSSFTMIDSNNNEWSITIGTDGALISTSA